MTAHAQQQTLVVVGAGQGGAEVAVQCRQKGFAGRIVLFGDEAEAPYTRPPLSKAFLSGEIGREDLLAKAATAYEASGVELRLGERVERIDRRDRRVIVGGGEEIAYDTVVLATGGRPRTLRVPGHDLGRIFYLRNIGDAEAIRPLLVAGARVVIVGGGYVGLEVATIAVKFGLSVTVVEGADRVLARVTSPEMSAFYTRQHREKGVTILTGRTVSEFVPNASSPDLVGGVACGEDAPIPADLVIVGIGLLPNVELAETAGLPVDNGIVVDDAGRTGDDCIYAMGDCAMHAHHGFLKRKMRIESLPNTLEQARIIAASICGQPVPAVTPPWFWSDQYALKLQMVGISEEYDELVIRGSEADASFIAFYLKEGRIIAADSVNRPGEFMLAKRLVAEARAIPAATLGDDSNPLRNAIAAH